MGSDETWAHQDRDLVIGILKPECGLYLGFVDALPHQVVGHGRHGEGLRHRRRIDTQVGVGKRPTGMFRRADEVSSRDHGESQAELDRQPRARAIPAAAWDDGYLSVLHEAGACVGPGGPAGVR